MTTWDLPNLERIVEPTTRFKNDNFELDKTYSNIVEETLNDNFVPVVLRNFSHGPSFTRIGVEPGVLKVGRETRRTRISEIESMAEVLAVELGVKSVRICPVTDQHFVGIEVPHKGVHRVSLWDAITGIKENIAQSKKEGLNFILGVDVRWHTYLYEMNKMPYLLITGMAESGKFTCLNSILTYLLLNKTPSDLRLLLIDFKRTELIEFSDIPHLVNPIITRSSQLYEALHWVQNEIEARILRFSQMGFKNIIAYNSHNQPQLPYVLVIINEGSEMLLEAPKDAERLLNRLTYQGGDTGIFFIFSTEVTRKDIFTKLNKLASFTRVTFALPSGENSKAAFGQEGGEKLNGRGDMLLQVPNHDLPIRLQGVFVSGIETERISDFWKKQVMHKKI